MVSQLAAASRLCAWASSHLFDGFRWLLDGIVVGRRAGWLSRGVCEQRERRRASIAMQIQWLVQLWIARTAPDATVGARQVGSLR